MEQIKFLLEEDEIPTSYYNIQADLPKPLDPVLHPGTRRPVGPQDLQPIFPMDLILQEVNRDRFVPIPEDVRRLYQLYRPTPLIRAKRFEERIGTKAHIYYKYEGSSPSGSHKLNTALAQVYCNAKEGVKRIATETGAGQWGTALAIACDFFGIQCKVYMVKVSFLQKPYRKALMQMFGASVVASPSVDTNAGRRILENDPKSPGSLGIAISEAVEDAATHDDTKYSLGSVLNHVLLHQTVVGQEAMKQMEKAGEFPDIVIGCCGGGSNFAGLAFPFIRERIAGRAVRAIAVEPASCPTLTKGTYAYDFGDTGELTPLLPMHTLGHSFVPPSIHAGGLRYHGVAPLVSRLLLDGLVEAQAYKQVEVFDAAREFARSEGIIPAPESSHALRAVIHEAREADKEGKPRVILFNLSGHGHFDMQSYDDFLAGRLEDHEMPVKEIERSVKALQSLGATA
ncbi:MAG: TrpB-like pyridoxal phosphate-dependent enzyme [Ignavibacteriales bacterium]|nr:TrpB-like pyridoxal phosphate-dependent enzyme [Ignavibacteriales bacterium]